MRTAWSLKNKKHMSHYTQAGCWIAKEWAVLQKKEKNKRRWTATTLLWNNGRFVCQRVFGTTAWWNMSRQHVSATAWKWRRRLQFSQSDETANESHRKHSTASRTHNQQLVFFCLQLLFKSQINLKIKSDCFYQATVFQRRKAQNLTVAFCHWRKCHENGFMF